MIGMQSFTEVIDTFTDKLGDQTGFANVLGTTQQNVSQMRQRNSIPSRFWPTVVKAAQEKNIQGITFETLAKLAASREQAA